jgi:hypothetical protein
MAHNCDAYLYASGKASTMVKADDLIKASRDVWSGGVDNKSASASKNPATM